MTIPLDTLAHTLRRAGINEQQADAHAEALVMAFSQGVATRGDLAEPGRRGSADLARMGKALDDRITEVEEKLGHRITEVEEKLNRRITEVEEKLGHRIDQVERALSDRITRVEEALNERIIQVEKALGGRIDALAGRVARLERELGELRLNMRWGFVVIGLLIILTSPLSTQLAGAVGILR